MKDGLTPAEAAAGVKDAVGRWGFEWMSSADLRARGKDELGVRGRALYHLGRVGVLGDVPAEVAVAVEAFFPPEVVRAAWEDGRNGRTPGEVARFYAEGCADIGRARFADDERTARAAVLVERVVDAAPTAGLPLFVGWRLVPRPDDAPGRLGLLLNVLREHRGAAHVAAVAAVGLGPLEAILAGSYGESSARFFEWPEPYPDPSPYRARWDAAEDLTSAAAALAYDALDAAERAELVPLVNALLS